MKPILNPANRKRIETFKSIVADLKAGEDHNITRPTTIKSFCKDPAVAAEFTKCPASMTAHALVRRSRPSHLSKNQWQTFQRLGKEGMAALESGGSKDELRQMLTTIASCTEAKLLWTPTR